MKKLSVMPKVALMLLVLVAMQPTAQAASPTFAYVANNFSNSVSVIDTNTKSVTATIAVGSVPTELAISLSHKYVVVTNQFGGSVSVISTATNSVVATVPVGSLPVGVILHQTGNSLT
jgi:YVTN family beta-propeller protein